ncbi:hypothetical protein QN277_018986 [Acacia crassicarpa]|uniref:Mediator complex subunit 15 KIX domain-containing protein n=1 Tax=Acacia crassicarpa TaxID=499986 RepID=A0AAE1JRP1_9FABA|nr:hypothetical protein QN277_018986 [Acacia crassicarpa]
MDTHDWRAQLLPQIRQRKVDEITDELKFYQSHGGELLEVQKIARCYEQKTYAGAASQEDYLQKISSMILSISEKYWRSSLQPVGRQRIIDKILLEKLRRHIPYSGQEGLDELRQIAARFEEKIYYSAASENDYNRGIFLKMPTVEKMGMDLQIQEDGL